MLQFCIIPLHIQNNHRTLFLFVVLAPHTRLLSICLAGLLCDLAGPLSTPLSESPAGPVLDKSARLDAIGLLGTNIRSSSEEALPTVRPGAAALVAWAWRCTDRPLATQTGLLEGEKNIRIHYRMYDNRFSVLLLFLLLILGNHISTFQNKDSNPSKLLFAEKIPSDPC